MPLREPRPYQQDGIDFMTEAVRCINGDDIGLGKTGQSVVSAAVLQSQRTLVVVPNHLKENWKAEIKLWIPKAPVRILEGSTEEKLSQLADFPGGFLITNIESIRMEKAIDKKTGKQKLVPTKLLKAFAKGKFQCLIADEAHKYANRNSAQSRGLHWLSQPQFIPACFLLTGSPFRNRVMDIWHLLHVVERKRYSSYWRFAFAHAGARKSAPWEYGRYQIEDHSPNPARLAKAIRYDFIRREKADHLELPPITHQTLTLALSGEQKRIYRDMENDMLAEVEGQTVLAVNLLSKITRLKQICISPVLMDTPESPKTRFSEVKLLALREIVEGTDHKIVVFTQFAKAVDYVGEMLTEARVSWTRYTGAPVDKKKVNGKLQRDVNEAKWKQGDTQVMLATYGAAGVGLNWTAAPVCVLLDKPWTHDDQIQAWGRVYRMGQELPVTVYHFRVKGTVEEWIEAKLDWKKKIADQVLGLLRERLTVT